MPPELKPKTLQPPDLNDLTREERIEAMVNWFLENFEDPVENMPHDSQEGGYLYIWGGPYDASEEISGAFPDAAEDEVEAAVEEVEAEGIHDWAPAHPDDPHELDDPVPFERHSALQSIKTPRFPDGITLAELSLSSAPIKRETMTFWYAAHHTPATGTYFGFGDATATQRSSPPSVSMLSALAPSQVQIGFGEGTFFNGGRSLTFLKGVFQEFVELTIIEEVAAFFDGLWVPKPSAPSPANAPDDIRVAILTALDSFSASLRELTTKPAVHGGIGHNAPPDDEPLAAEETVAALKAVNDMRLAVSSGNHPAILETIWSEVAALAAKLGTWALTQLNSFFDAFMPAAGKALGEKIPHLLMAISIWSTHVEIAHLIKILLFLL